MAKVEANSLDKIIGLIKDKLEKQKEIQNDLISVDRELEGLYSQARSALQGTGMALVLMDSFAGTMVTGKKLDITDWTQLRVGDIVRVKTYGDPRWTQGEVQQIEPEDYDGALIFRVDNELSDGSNWVELGSDEWEFISRP